jgi:hypothetical protein
MNLYKVDLVTDLSRTVCNEQIPIQWILSCRSLSLFLKSCFNYISYQFSKDPRYFYSALKNLPVKPFDFVRDLTPNERWDEIVEVKKPKRIGIVTQDDYSVASAYLETQRERFRKLGIEDYVILAANHAKHCDGHYTGEAEINVAPNLLLEILVRYAGVPIVGDGPISAVLKNCPGELRENFINVEQ